MSDWTDHHGHTEWAYERDPWEAERELADVEHREHVEDERVERLARFEDVPPLRSARVRRAA